MGSVVKHGVSRHSMPWAQSGSVLLIHGLWLGSGQRTETVCQQVLQHYSTQSCCEQKAINILQSSWGLTKNIAFSSSVSSQ